MFDTDLLDRIESLAIRLGETREQREALEAKKPLAGVPSAEDVVSLVRAMGNGRKIDAIKHYRTLTGEGLKESKDAVEFVMNRFYQDHYNNP